MSRITPADLMVVVKAAIKMAQQDSTIAEEEADFLEDMLKAGGVDPFDVGQFDQTIKEDVMTLAQSLEGTKAKRVFLLTLATIAVSDGVLEDHERRFFTDMAKAMGVGTINLDKLSFAEGRRTVLRLVAQANQDVEYKSQPTDMDML